MGPKTLSVLVASLDANPWTLALFLKAQEESDVTQGA